MRIDTKTRNQIISFQRNEISEYHIYKALASRLKDEKNRRVLQKIAAQELKSDSLFRKGIRYGM